MPAPSEFPIVFESVRAILKPYAKKLTVKNDTSGNGSDGINKKVAVDIVLRQWF